MNDDVRSDPPHLASDQPLPSLADYLAAHRERLLQAWQAAVDADGELTSSDDLSRTEFRNHIPQVLTRFEACLRRGCERCALAPKADDQDDSLEHGEHRWKQGYDLREVILEWGHLHQCLLREVESARDDLPPFTPDAFVRALHVLANLVNTAIADSAEQYARLQQKEAINERNDLETTVARFTDDGERRVRLWRESAHDLRGQLSIITSATSLMEEAYLEEELRLESLEMLNKGTRSLKEMLAGLLENAQSQAVREERRLGSFDAAMLLGGLCAASQPLARERGLTLHPKGPESLSVEGDRGKVQRIAQNLVLNALHYTVTGGVTLSWREDDNDTWSFEVRDTGPGISDRDVGDSAEGEQPPPGEGIGLTIVHRLGELLGAQVETLVCRAGGTLFKVTLPRRYAA